ncbi:MAG: UbiA family prenyltransferase [Bacteroidetes bacterium]|jgi:4-hydroxybenzoate polyprenyltransferase|nr:UbiA family prenyltransferase [Bacteroidota bacterium]
MERYISTYRPLNMVFIAVAQWLCAYFLDAKAILPDLVTGGLYWLMTGTAACTAFGYWVNDLLDKERDILNNGTVSDIHSLPLAVIYVHLFVFVCIAIGCGFMLGTWFIGLFVVTLLALFLYSRWLKNIAVIGNVIVALLCYCSTYSVYVLFPSIDSMLLIYFALLATATTLFREMVKDAEDIEGDGQTGAKTLPIIVGLKAVNIGVYALILVLMPTIIVLVASHRAYFEGTLLYLYYIYTFLFILVPFFKVAMDVRYAATKEEYTDISALLKYIFFTGILSILFF